MEYRAKVTIGVGLRVRGVLERYALMDCARMFEMMERIVPWIVDITIGEGIFHCARVGDIRYIVILITN